VKILQANAQTALIMTRRILVSYYAAALLFLLLDHTFGIDIRLAFLEANSSVRLTYYAFCLACFAGMLLRPGQDLVTPPELLNFLLSGCIAYVAWARGIAELAKRRL